MVPGGASARPWPPLLGLGDAAEAEPSESKPKLIGRQMKRLPLDESSHKSGKADVLAIARMPWSFMIAAAAKTKLVDFRFTSYWYSNYLVDV